MANCGIFLFYSFTPFTIYLDFLGDFSHLLFARQLWERNEKLGKSQRPFFAPMNAALVRKMPEICHC